MKMLLAGIVALSTTATFAQSITVDQMAALLSQKKASLEAVNPGMSKKVTTTGSYTTEENAVCDYTQVAIQSILKIEGDKIIILSQEEFIPGKGLGCQGTERSSQKVVFFEDKPSLAADLEDLKSSNPSSIVLNGDLVSLLLKVRESQEDGSEIQSNIKITYDLTKPSFKNMILNETSADKTVITDMADIDVNSVDLKKVVFCPEADSVEEECMEGDFSDILF